MKEFKIQVSVKKTVIVTEREWKDNGGIGDFDEFSATQYVKACLIEDLRNNPDYGLVKIIHSKDIRQK